MAQSTTPAPFIEGYKEIAEAIKVRSRRAVTEERVRSWSDPTAQDRLPIEFFRGTPGIAPEQLDDWCERQQGKRHGLASRKRA